MTKRTEAILAGAGNLLAVAGLLFVQFCLQPPLGTNTASHGGGTTGTPGGIWLLHTYGVRALVTLWVLGMMAYYLYHLFTRNRRISMLVGILWAVALPTLNIAAMLVYWLVYLRPDLKSGQDAYEYGD